MAVNNSSGVIALLLLSFVIRSHGVRVQFFEKENFEGEMFEVISSASCTNLPTELQGLRGSTKATSCVVIFTEYDCKDKGQGIVVRFEESSLPGRDFNNTAFEYENFSVKSFKECKNVESSRGRRDACGSSVCVKFNASVFKFESLHDQSDLVGTILTKQMRWSTTTNEAPVSIKSFHAAVERFSETAEFEFNEIPRDIESIHFGRRALSGFKSSIPFYFSEAVRKLSTQLPTVFQGRSRITKSYKVETNDVFEINQTISVPPCLKYSENSFVEVRNGIKISYKVYFKITGVHQRTANRLTVEEIQKSFVVDKTQLMFLEGDVHADKFTAVATSFAALKAKYVSNLVFNVVGRRIPGCKLD